MSDKCVIYQTENGLAVLHPNTEFLQTYTVQDVAQKDVPAGIPYKIISVSDLPTSTEFFGAWTADMSNPDGYGMGHDAWWAEKHGNSQ
jgi:hypothetical protein